MSTGYHQCLGEGCTKWITYRFALCAECEKKYGKSVKDWPEWLRFLWNDIQRERRRNQKIRIHEVSYVDFEDKDEE